ncbi:hypothetical protein GALL_392080 [mine drainage metagenome]|uniref:Uncharacterized protein n=1 Tax=mine drainage metagenome TaxID=410659 RepID=A0A1J5Q7A2_9ZZZZ
MGQSLLAGDLGCRVRPPPVAGRNPGCRAIDRRPALRRRDRLRQHAAGADRRMAGAETGQPHRSPTGHPPHHPEIFCPRRSAGLPDRAHRRGRHTPGRRHHAGFGGILFLVELVDRRQHGSHHRRPVDVLPAGDPARTMGTAPADRCAAPVDTAGRPDRRIHIRVPRRAVAPPARIRQPRRSD